MSRPSKPSALRLFLRYTIPPLAITVAGLLEARLEPDNPRLGLLYLVVSVTAWSEGVVAAIVATAVGLFVGAAFVLEPTWSFSLESHSDVVALVIFLLVSAGIILLRHAHQRELDSRKRAQEALGASLAELRAMSEAMQTELERRVAERTRALEAEIAERRSVERTLRDRTVQLVRSNEDLERFAYVSSHDLQEPLRMVVAYSQLLAERYGDKLGPDADECIRYSVEGALRMQTLIRDLLAYSRIAARSRAPERVESRRLLAVALENLHVAIVESGARIESGKLPAVRADATQLVQVFQNLVGNAVKFRRSEAPVVRVDAERRPRGDGGHEWVFSVADNGVGIERDYHERIFEPFRRLHTRERYPGNGIGLAICKKVVQRHGGDIWVESEPGRGSTFRFTLPDASPIAPPAKSVNGAAA
ncbi:MAG TPA: ATP-binding protein [Planctomycetota bacterium]|nr:ATP-binding protein [Planctomycetota bacterium]